MKIEVLQRSHNRKDFDCGQVELNRFIQQFALQHHKTGTSKTYACLDNDNQVIGFYSLASMAISFEQVDSHLTHKLPRYPIPSIVIGRFAVSKHSQGAGIGKKLLAHALRQVSLAAQIVGISFVVVHAKNDQAAAFYLALGFIALSSDPLILVLPVNEIP